MTKFRVTYYGSKGTTYSELQEDYWEGDLYEGDWNAPFPNTEKDSLAFGLEESIYQSDFCPPIFCEREKIVRITVKKEN
jgi:hypothetical protein